VLETIAIPEPMTAVSASAVGLLLLFARWPRERSCSGRTGVQV
jgi:hypothetical protein